MRYLPLLINLLLLALLLGFIADVVVSAVRDSRRPATPEDGCCGCGADLCDVIVAPNERGRGEGYCWTCIDTWPGPDTAQPLNQLGFYVFEGRGRDSR